MDKIRTEEVGGNITLCVIASCFGLIMLLGDFVPSSGVALVLFIMVTLMLNYLTTLELDEKEHKNDKFFN
jgi:lipoprotein